MGWSLVPAQLAIFKITNRACFCASSLKGQSISKALQEAPRAAWTGTNTMNHKFLPLMGCIFSHGARNFLFINLPPFLILNFHPPHHKKLLILLFHQSYTTNAWEISVKQLLRYLHSHFRKLSRISKSTNLIRCFI